MKTLKIILTLTAIFCIYVCNAQTTDTIVYRYDNAGNRISRNIVALKSGTLVNDNNTIFNKETQQLKEDFKAEEFYNDKLEEQKITVYPNPTAGQMVIQITPFNTGTTTKLELYDISGKQVLQRNNLSEYTGINISSSPSGEYIMRVYIGDKVSVWKIIKE